MTKPKLIKANYNTTAYFDFNELKIDWEKVFDYYIKYSEHTVTFEDGVERTYDPTYVHQVDYKWADSQNVYDEKGIIIEDY